jgi:hypothetical protein
VARVSVRADWASGWSGAGEGMCERRPGRNGLRFGGAGWVNFGDLGQGGLLAGVCVHIARVCNAMQCRGFGRSTVRPRTTHTLDRLTDGPG